MYTCTCVHVILFSLQYSYSEAFPEPGPPQLSSYKKQHVKNSPKMFPVYISCVKTPSNFTVQLIGKENSTTLEMFQDDMTRFYSREGGEEYKIKKPYVGQVCSIIRFIY